MTTRSEFVVKHAWTSNRKGPVRWLFSHFIRHKLIILMLLIGAFGNAALAAAIPIYIGQGFDAILQEQPDLNTLFSCSIWLTISQIVRSLLQFARNFGSEVLGMRVERDAREELYGALLGKSMRFHDSYPSGEMMARATNDVHELALMFAPGLNMVIGSIFFLIVPIFVAPRYHPTLAFTPTIFLIGYILALHRYLRRLNPVTAEVRQSFGELNAGLTQAIEGIETVKGAVQEEAEIKRFEKNALAVRDYLVEQGKVEANFLPLLLMGLANGIGLWHSIVLYQAHLITVGNVVAYMALLALFGFPVFVSIYSYSQISSGISSARRILSVIESETELDQNLGGYNASMRGAISFENVSFRYRTQGADGLLAASETLKNISFAIEPGQTLAIVGQTGAGKSTIAKLINRTYDIDQGQILIDGVDVREWDLASLRQQISMIEQDIFLFSRKISENMTFGSPDATVQEMLEAAQAAQAHQFISELPKGYETVVGERGVMLSGGQRQRIALARAFLVRPSILILDDSTSAIDSATEDQIQQAIDAAAEGRTTILITHRLSQIRRANKILVLKQGSVAAIGTHEELLQQSEAYRNIFAR